MLDRLVELTEALRRAGVPVSVGEAIDATRSLRYLPLEDRNAVRSTLAATLVKDQGHRPAFDTLFELYFAAAPPDDPESDDDPAAPAPDPEQLMEELFRAMTAGDGGGVRELARRAVLGFGRIENSPSGSRYFQYPVYRAIDLQRLLARFDEGAPGDDPLEQRLARDDFRQQMQDFRTAVEREVQGRVAARKGPASVARTALRPLAEDVDLLTATADDVANVRRAIRPLARKLGTRLAMKRRRANRGSLDIRRTIRGSLSTGGVPLDLRFRHRAPHRPELFVLCDVSDSVSRFARFSLMLVHALSAEFARVRSFAFIDTLDEVTRLFEHEDFVAAVDRMGREADVVRFDGHSDYGGSLERFWELCEDDLGPKATVLILGDARNNFRTSRATLLREVRRKARHTYWLNPEPRSFWDSGDSLASLYAAETDEMVEVRNLGQLEDFIARVL